MATHKVQAAALGMDPGGTGTALDLAELWLLKMGTCNVAHLQSRVGTIFGCQRMTHKPHRERNQEMRWLTTMRRVA
jgi:hypothetical protein